jgi:DNA-binding PadR family transcriptional regulator
MDNPNEGVSIYSLKEELTSNNYTKLAVTLGLKRLMAIDFIEFTIESDYNNEYTVYKITDKGMQWLLDNKTGLELTISSNDVGSNEGNENDNSFSSDIPF